MEKLLPRHASFATELPAPVSQAVRALKHHLEEIYGARFQSLYLFGSYARGDYREDSDVDLLIVLSGEVNPCQEIDHLSGLVADLSWRYGVFLTILPIPADWLLNRQSPLYVRVRQEGIPL
jgi:predicted nucleotidyltransferase